MITLTLHFKGVITKSSQLKPQQPAYICYHADLIFKKFFFNVQFSISYCGFRQKDLVFLNIKKSKRYLVCIITMHYYIKISMKTYATLPNSRKLVKLVCLEFSFLEHVINQDTGHKFLSHMSDFKILYCALCLKKVNDFTKKV